MSPFTTDFRGVFGVPPDVVCMGRLHDADELHIWKPRSCVSKGWSTEYHEYCRQCGVERVRVV
jgi:hypothetical protein